MDGDRSTSEGYLTPEQLAAGLGQEPGGAYDREPDDGSLPRDPDCYCPGCHEPADIDCRCTAADHAAHRSRHDLAVPFEHPEPEGVEYTVRDEHGRIVEIVVGDVRTYVEQPPLDEEPPEPAGRV